MAYSINKIILLGNAGQDAEVSYSTTGTAYCRFSLATSESYKDGSGEWQNKTLWHNCVLFGKVAESIGKLIKKGTKLYLEGKIKYDEYEKDGVKRYSTSIVCSDFNGIVILDKKESAEKEFPEPTEYFSTATKETSPEDDLPF